MWRHRPHPVGVQTCRPWLSVPPNIPLFSDLRSFLVGKFELRREIVTNDGQVYRLSGAASFSIEQDHELTYLESGVLNSRTAAVEVSRTYRYLLTGATSASVRFADGAHFHDLELATGRCRLTHHCDDDLYLGLIVVRGTDLLTRWRCRGPNKDYVATTRLSRPVPAPTIPQ